MNLPMNVPANFHCLSCGAPNICSSNNAELYFKNIKQICVECKADIDWWEASVKSISKNFMYTQAFGILGAQGTIFKFALPPGKTTVLKFRDYGIPDNARILAINYTPNGPLIPLQWHSNQLVEGNSTWFGGNQTNEVHLWPAELSGERRETEINCLVHWIVTSTDDTVTGNLVDAFSAYAIEKFVDAITPANVAVEASINKVLNDYLGHFVGKRHVKEFLENNATYGSQLNVVLPVLSALNKCPGMPENVRGQLNRLRDLRNQLVHTGHLKMPVNKQEMAELLAAATLGVSYASFFGGFVSKNMP